MLKAILFFGAFFYGITAGIDYLMSPKFQEYGDRTKAPWTCEVNNIVGHSLMFGNRYGEAIGFFKKTIERCPETAACEVGEFEVAECLSKLNKNREALDAYRQFAEKYKGTKRAKIAERAMQIIQVS